MHYILLFLLLAIVVVYVVWIILALLAQIFSLVVLFGLAAFSIAAVAGVLVGVVLPWQVLRGKGKAPFRQLTPEAVVAGDVAGAKPSGPNREFGWDRAWPTYMPYQAAEDRKAVWAETNRHLGGLWTRCKRMGWGAVIAWPPLGGYALGVWASAASWLLVMMTLGGIVSIAQRLILAQTRASDIRFRRRARATLKCPHDFAETSLPGYRCSNPDCDIVHWTMLPGPLGRLTRRCECGTSLPNTVRTAAASLTPVCPTCRLNMVMGSGMRQTIQVPVIGAVGAGKTRLLGAALTELSEAVTALGGSFEALTESAETYLTRSRSWFQQQAPTSKTAHRDVEGLPYTITLGGLVLELQLMDAAGEAFTSWDTTAELRYLDGAKALVYVIDPLAWGDVRTELRRSGLDSTVLVASGDQEAAYAAAIDRMRADQIPVDRKELAVVLSKGDVLLRLPCARGLHRFDSDSLRSWMLDHDFDLLIRRMEGDFGTVHYFLADSLTPRGRDHQLNPWWPLEWIVRTNDAPFALSPPEASDAAQPAPAGKS